MENRAKKILRIAAVVGVLALIVLVFLSPRLLKTKTTSAQSAHENKSAERKILYWYDAMNPQNHYDKPGKAPDGMDLVPKYAEQDGPVADQPGGKKIKYWYDPM